MIDYNFIVAFGVVTPIVYLILHFIKPSKYFSTQSQGGKEE